MTTETLEPLLCDREIADRSASFTANLPILKRSGWTTSDHRCGMELARSIYEVERSARERENAALRAMVAELEGRLARLAGALHFAARGVPLPESKL